MERFSLFRKIAGFGFTKKIKAWLWGTGLEQPSVNWREFEAIPLKPEHCVIAFGIPMTKDGLENSRHMEGSFINGNKEKLNEEQITNLIENFDQFKRECNLFDAEILDHVTCEEFQSLFFKTPCYRAIILFSHCDESSGKIEFKDGMAKPTFIMKGLPEKYSGIIDLHVCRPRVLVKMLKAKYLEEVMVRSLPDEVYPSDGFHFYRLLFIHLKNADKTYKEAINDIADKLSTTNKMSDYLKS